MNHPDSNSVEVWLAFCIASHSNQYTAFDHIVTRVDCISITMILGNKCLLSLIGWKNLCMVSIATSIQTSLRHKLLLDGTDFIKGLWVYNWNIVKIPFVLISLIMIQSGNNFAHAMTAELSWHVQNSDLIIQLLFIQEQHVFYKISIMSS